MSAMLRDKSAFKLALGAGVVVAGATGALWYLRRGQTKRPAKGPTVGESPAQPPATEPQTAVKTAVEAKDPLPPSPPPAAEKQVSVDHGEETIKSAQRISIQIPVPPADGDASVGSMSPDNLSITSETFEKVSPSQLGSQSNTPPALSTPPYPPKDTESLGESFGSTALGESFEQVSLGSQLKEEEKEEKERAEREKEEKEEGKKEEKEEEKEEKKDAPQVKTEEVKTEEAKDEVVKEEPPLKEEEVNDTVHVTTESAQVSDEMDGVPSAVFPPDFDPVAIPDEATILLMDLETTGFGDAHITQFAVLEHGGDERRFMRYVLPRKPITFAASEITGIRMERRDGAEVLMAHGQEVHAVPIRSLMEEFFRWVDGLKPAVMLAHNGRTFDFRILIKALQSIDQLDEFCEHVTTFADTLPLFKKKVPGRRSYKLPILVEDILGSDYAAHDAMEDIVALSQLMTTLGITPSDIQGQSFTPHDVVQRMNYLSVRNQNLPSLSPLIEEGICSMSLAEKLAGSGLQMQDLLGIYRQQGIEGLMATITAENAQGTARVAGSPRVLHKFVSLLSAYFDKNP